MSEPTKEILGDYELLELIGDGAQGRVFKARKIAGEGADPQKLFAVKVLRFSGDDQKKLARFEKSAATLQKLAHPAIVGYFGSYAWHTGEWDEAHCLVMEFLDGLPLDEVIKRNPRGLPWLQVKPIFEACLEGLIFARSKGIIHRDIKPSNIFITKAGEAKLIDFDIARREDDSQASTAGWRGTFDYMAPDFVQIENFRGDEQSDVFSLGVCLFQALTGRLPYPPLGDGAHIGYLSRWHDISNAKPKADAGIFRALVNARQLAVKSQHPDREKRFKTFQEMLDALRAVQFRKLEHKGVETYELIDWLGRGGFGEVYLGRRVSDGSRVAVKRLSAHECSSRFVKEAQILQKYPHAAIVRYVDFVEVTGREGEKQLFLVLEFLEGMPRYSLRHRIKEEGRIPPREAVRLFIHYLSGLQFLHENARPIIHRDIKPANLYAPPRRPEDGRIFDLGIARDVEGAATTGPIPGTLDYMAPEFASGGDDRGSPASDIYAIGLCLYEAITGKSPFPRLPADITAAWTKFIERCNGTFEPDLTDDVFMECPALADAVRKALDRDPAKRYAKASLLRRDLEALLPSLPAEEVDAEGATSTSFAEFVRGEDVPSELETDSHGAPTAEAPVSSQLQPGGTPAAPSFPDAGGKKTSPLLAIVVVLLVLGAIGGFLLFIKGGRDEGTAAGGTPQTQAQQTQAPPPEPAFTLDAKFTMPTAASAYVTDLAAEIARIRKGVDDGSVRGTGVRQALGVLENQATGLPQLFRSAFDAALIAKDYKTAGTLIDDWTRTKASCVTMGMTEAQHDARTQEMRALMGSHQLDAALAATRQAIPANALAEGAWAQAEAAAVQLAQVEDNGWPGVATDDRDARIASVASALRSIVDIKLSSVTASGDLATLKSRAPGLAKRFGDSFDGRGMAIAQADKGRDQFQSEVDALQADVPSEAATAADLARAESVASKLKDMPSRSWTGVSDSEKQAAISRIREVLLPVLAAAMANMRNDALEQVRTASSIDAAKARLNEMAQRYPNATAFVTAAHKKALQDVDVAWKARPPAPTPTVQPVMPTVTKTPDVAPVQQPVAPGKPKDPNEEKLIKAIQEGYKAFQPQGVPPFEENAANQLLTSLGALPRDVKAPDLAISPKSAQDFTAAVNSIWENATAFTGPFGARVQEAVWKNIHDELAKTAETTLKGAIFSSPPSQQARIRRSFIKLLSGIDTMTAGRVAASTPQDVLRARVTLYFEEGFFNDALLTERVGGDATIESQVPWIKELFEKVRQKSGIKFQ